MSGSAYYTDVKNDIFLTPFGDEDEPAGSTIDGFFVNLDKTRRAGVELGGGLQVPCGPLAVCELRLHPRHLPERMPTSSDPLGATIRASSIPSRPTTRCARATAFRWCPITRSSLAGWRKSGEYVSVGADGRYIGKQYLRGDEANVTAPLDGYFVADARAGVEFGRWEINGIVTNLFQNRSADLRHVQHQSGESAGPDRRAVPDAQSTANVPTRGPDDRWAGSGRGEETERPKGSAFSPFSPFSLPLTTFAPDSRPENVLKIAVCIKRVPDMEMRFSIAADTKSLDQGGLKYEMGDFDGYALEVGLQLVEKQGPGEVVVVTLGPDSCAGDAPEGAGDGRDAGRAAQVRRRSV